MDLLDKHRNRQEFGDMIASAGKDDVCRALRDILPAQNFDGWQPFIDKLRENFANSKDLDFTLRAV